MERTLCEDRESCRSVLDDELGCDTAQSQSVSQLRSYGMSQKLLKKNKRNSRKTGTGSICALSHSPHTSFTVGGGSLVIVTLTGRLHVAVDGHVDVVCLLFSPSSTFRTDRVFPAKSWSQKANNEFLRLNNIDLLLFSILLK